MVRNNTHRIGSLERRMNQINRQLNQLGNYQQRLTTLENFSYAITLLVNSLVGRQIPGALEAYGQQRVYRRQPRVTDEERNRISQIFREFINYWERSRTEGLESLENSKQDVLKVYPNDSQWAEYVERFYGDTRREKEESYIRQHEGIVGLVEVFSELTGVNLTPNF